MCKKVILGTVLTVLMSVSASTVFACGGEASGKHIGNITNVNADKSTFTIRDMETNSPITFNATAEIMNEVKNAKGRVMVNFEENNDGGLNATGVAF